MSSVRKSQPSVKPVQLAEPAAAPTFVPRRKRPLALAACAAVLIAWLSFLAYMAFRG